jgi:hypothetical protein
MFTKNISVTETIESHLNTSSDENGEDDSFDESGKDEFDSQSIDDIKSKITRYKYYITKINNKRKELLRDKSISLWQVVYYTFFGDYNNGAVTLHELNLRCKFLFNMDKVYGFEKEIEKKKIKPLTNIEQFIRMYSLKKDDNLPKKLIAEKKDKKDKEKNKDMLELQRKITAYNLKKRSNMIDMKESKEYKEDDLNLKKASNSKIKVDGSNKNLNGNNNQNQNKIKGMSKSKSADFIDASVNVNKETTEKRHYLKSLLELNGFNLQDEELYDIIQELTAKYKENKDRQKLDNLTKIIKGDFIYKQELDNAMKTNDPFLNELSYLLDVNSERPFLINNIDVDLISKYEHSLGPQDRLSRQVNNFISKILSKLNPNFKIDD